jgi:hypothetical protein
MSRLYPLVLCLSGCGFLGIESLPPGSDAATDALTDGGQCEVVSPADYCASIPKISAIPVIDGAIDCGLVVQSFPPAGWFETSGQPLPSYVGTRFAAAWHPAGLYVYVEIDDISLYPAAVSPGMLFCGDSAEIYVDTDGTFSAAPTYDTPGTRQFLARAPMSGGQRESTGESFSMQTRIETWRAAGFGTWARPGGYVLEAFITAEDLDIGALDFVAGGKIGLDLGVNVSTADGSPSECGTRIGQYFLRDQATTSVPCYGRPYCDVRAFCTPMLLP